MPIDVTMPSYLPKNIEDDAVGFVVSEDFDERNTKIVIDLGHTIISNNQRARFVIACASEYINSTLDEILRAYKIPSDRITHLYPEGEEPMSDYDYNQDSVNRLDIHTVEGDRYNMPSLIEYAQNNRRSFPARPRSKNRKPDKFYHARGSNSLNILEFYKRLIGVFKLDTIVILSDNPHSTEINELYKSSLQYGFKIITETSDGDFNNMSNPLDQRNHKRFYGGLFKNESIEEN